MPGATCFFYRMINKYRKIDLDDFEYFFDEELVERPSAKTKNNWKQNFYLIKQYNIYYVNKQIIYTLIMIDFYLKTNYLIVCKFLFNNFKRSLH